MRPRSFRRAGTSSGKYDSSLVPLILKDDRMEDVPNMTRSYGGSDLTDASSKSSCNMSGSTLFLPSAGSKPVEQIKLEPQGAGYECDYKEGFRPASRFVRLLGRFKTRQKLADDPHESLSFLDDRTSAVTRTASPGSSCRPEHPIRSQSSPSLSTKDTTLAPILNDSLESKPSQEKKKWKIGWSGKSKRIVKETAEQVSQPVLITVNQEPRKPRARARQKKETTQIGPSGPSNEANHVVEANSGKKVQNELDGVAESGISCESLPTCLCVSDSTVPVPCESEPTSTGQVGDFGTQSDNPDEVPETAESPAATTVRTQRPFDRLQCVKRPKDVANMRALFVHDDETYEEGKILEPRTVDDETYEGSKTVEPRTVDDYSFSVITGNTTMFSHETGFTGATGRTDYTGATGYTNNTDFTFGTGYTNVTESVVENGMPERCGSNYTENSLLSSTSRPSPAADEGEPNGRGALLGIVQGISSMADELLISGSCFSCANDGNASVASTTQ